MSNPTSNPKLPPAVEYLHKLQAERRSLVEKNTRLRAALKKYGRHLEGCNDWNDKGFEDIKCDCGWEQARKFL